jgi:hypothetical protein
VAGEVGTGCSVLLLAEDLKSLRQLCARGRHCTVGLLGQVLAGLLDEGGIHSCSGKEDAYQSSMWYGDHRLVKFVSNAKDVLVGVRVDF